MKIISVNVGLPREVEWKGQRIETGIFKEPAQGRVEVRRLNLVGDRQADLRVHGGRNKAVYGYPSEHYSLWRAELSEIDLPWGMFGENLTTQGLSESTLHIGDVLRIGTAVLQVTQPRMPCFKLGIKFGRDDIIKMFWESGRLGFYFCVVEEGEMGAGDAITLLERERHGVSVADIHRLRTAQDADRDLLQRALSVAALPSGWRQEFEERIRTKS